jgi:ATP-dependent DNA ligase
MVVRRCDWDSRSCAAEAARIAILYAFDVVKHEGDDLRESPLLDREAALVPLLRKALSGRASRLDAPGH